jgi:hypothetical protein
MRPRDAAAAVLALAGLLACAPARAETTGCTPVASLPATLSTSGHYCLDADLTTASASATGILIAASNVLLDCNDHRVSNTSAGNTAVGIYVDGTVTGAQVRNCRVEGYYNGIYSGYSGLPEPRGTHLVGNQVKGALVGLYLWGSGNLVEDNVVSDGERTGSGYPTGISFEFNPGDGAVGNVIRGNTIIAFKPTQPVAAELHYTIGINLGYQNGTVVEDNLIEGLYARTGGGVYGISSHQSRDLVLRGNRILSSPPLAAPFDGGNWAGINLQGDSTVLGTPSCSDNTVGHFNSNYGGCSATGNLSF